MFTSPPSLHSERGRYGMQTLTPEELQALLQRQEPKGEQLQRRRSRLLSGVTVQPYDMQATLTLTPRQRAMIRQWADQFAQSLRYALIPSLRMTFELRLNDEGLNSLSELSERWKGKAFVAPITTSGRLRGDHYLAISSNLAMVVIDRLLGGPGTVSQSLLQRTLSRLEVSLLLKFLEKVARSLLAVVTGEEGTNSSSAKPLDIGRANRDTHRQSLLLQPLLRLSVGARERLPLDCLESRRSQGA